MTLGSTVSVTWTLLMRKVVGFVTTVLEERNKYLQTHSHVRDKCVRRPPVVQSKSLGIAGSVDPPPPLFVQPNPPSKI